MRRFKKIYVEITNACNLSCEICPGTSRKKSSMSPEAFDEVLGKIRPFSDYIYLHVMGEPLLHPQFPEILGICGKHGFKVNIATNGVFIGKHKDAILGAAAVRQVNFSIHCMEIQRESALPENYLRDILAFIDEGRRKTGIYFALRIWTMKPGMKASEAILEEIRAFFGLPGKIEDLERKGKGVQLAPKVFLNFAEEFKWPSVDSETAGEKGFCLGMRDQCAILADGTVVPCCLDKDGVMSLGNIFREDFSAIVGGERADRILKGFSEGHAVEKLCRSCEFRSRFDRE
mgnify:CR=1 FL=1